MEYAFCISTAEPGDIKKFSEEVTHFLSNINMYDNIMIIGDLNIDTNYNSDKLYNPTELFYVFDLLRLICINTCSKSSDHRSVNVF